MRKAVYFFCDDAELDPVAAGVLEVLRNSLELKESGITVDGMPAYAYTDAQGDRFDFVRCAYYFSHRYEQYLPVACESFSEYDVAGYINWHGGANAPDRVLTVHSIGNVVTGHFAPSDPTLMHNLITAMEEERAAAGLEEFTVHTEATHWSGAIHGSDPALIEGFPVPIYDIEIGSEPETLKNKAAHGVLARTLLRVFEKDVRPKVIFCLGGIHFDDNYSHALLQKELPISIGHFLPTIWLVNGDYTEQRGLDFLAHALETVHGGADAIVYNDNMKKPVKDCVRLFAQKTGLPLLKHRRLHQPLEMEWKE